MFTFNGISAEKGKPQYSPKGRPICFNMPAATLASDILALGFTVCVSLLEM